MAVLSSSTLNFYHASTFIDYDIKPTYLQFEPIANIETTTPADKRKRLTGQIISAYEADDNAGVLKRVGEVLASNQTDVVHDVLAHLAQVMIDLNKQKQAEVKRFLGWLEKKLKIAPKDGKTGLDVFTGKTIIQNYLGDYQKGEEALPWNEGKDHLYYRLYQNRNRYHADLDAVAGEIEQEYEQSLAVLLPIKEQLARTDALIDQIVYKLYGLTDEEIELIERPQYEQAVTSARAAAIADEKLADDEKLSQIGDEIAPAAVRYVEVTPVEAARASLTDTFPAWTNLPEKLQKLITSAEKDYLDETRTDYTGSLANFAKVVEISMVEALFKPFRAAGYTAKDVENKVAFKKFMEGKRELTLGNFEFLLSSKEKTFREYVAANLYRDAEKTIFAKDGMRAYFTRDEIERRNVAVHQDLVSRSDAEAARKWAFGILEYLL